MKIDIEEVVCVRSTQDIRARRRVSCIKDERDRQIDVQSKGYAAEIMVMVSEILMIAALVKGSPLWRGFLSVALTGCAAGLVHKYIVYREKPYLYIGLVLGIAALTLLIACIRVM